MPNHNLSRTRVQRLIDERIPRPDWKDSDARRKQVVAVARRTLSTHPQSLAELTQVRNKKQKEVAREMGLRTQTVKDKCGRQLFKGYADIPNNEYHQEFDKILWAICKDLDY